MLQSDGASAWREDVLKDLSVFKEVLGHRVDDLPLPRSDISKWEELWFAFPGAWKRLVSAFIRTAAADEFAFLGACERAGICTSDALPVVEDEEWMCGTCFSCFKTQGRLTIHRTQAHGVECPLRSRVVGSVCPFCATDFRSRLRVRTHLVRGAASCRARAQSLPVLDSEVCALENARERDDAARARSRGAHPLQGPPRRRVAVQG